MLQREAREEQSRIVAAVDCGTNSIRLLVAQFGADGRLRDLHREMRIIRLGEGVDATRRISPAAITRCREALTEYVDIAARLGAQAIRMVATSATRDASNREDFFAMTATVLGRCFPGAIAEVISGEVEAELTFAGAIGDLDPAQGPFLVTDLGGGSTELVLGEVLPVGGSRISSSRSMDIGCVRLTERVLHSQPPTAAEVQAAQELVATELTAASEVVDVSKARTWVGVAGTFTSLAAIATGMSSYDSERIHLTRLDLAALRSTCIRLWEMTPEQRMAQGPLHPGRADVIGGGAVIAAALATMLSEVGLQEIVVSEKDILDGIALSLRPAVHK